MRQLEQIGHVYDPRKKEVEDIFLPELLFPLENQFPSLETIIQLSEKKACHNENILVTLVLPLLT